MADGSLGSLFVSLGIRDEMSSTLRKIVDGMKGVDEATNKARKQGEELVNKLNSVNGDAFVKVFKDASKYIEENAKGVSGIVSALMRASSDTKNGVLGKILGAKDLADISRLLNVINSELAKMPHQSKEDNAAIKAWQSRISNALSYIQILRDVESAQNRIASTKSDNPNVNTAKLKAANDQLSAFKKNLLELVNMDGIDNSNVLSYYRKLSSMLKGMSNETISLFKKDNPISVFNSNFDKVDSTLSRVEDKLRVINDLKNEGLKKGYNTSMLDDRILELGNKKTLLETALLNKNGELGNNAELRKTLSSTAAELSKVTDATKYYGREKGKVIAQEREHDKAVARSARNRKELADNTRNLKDLYSQLNHEISKAESHGMKGLQLGVSTAQLDKALADMRDFANIVNNVRPGLMGKGGRPALADYKQQANDLRRSLSEAVSAQKELNSAQEKSNRKADAKAERDKAQAIREKNTAENQRQSELENSLRRIQSMQKALDNLQEKRFTSKMLGLDTSEAEAKINTLKEHIRQLYEIAARLDSKDMTAVGKLGNLGNGRETQAANDLARSYDKANKEAQRGVDIEQKRQQEIAKSAARVQADFVRGFEKANSSAGKLSSTIQDLKSLFLQGGLVFGAQQFAMSIITTGGEIEKQHIALQSILGDMQNANTLFGQIKELALNSPFTFSELNRDVKQLAAYGVEYDQLYDTTKRLADMSSGLGVSFDRIALAFGQVQARGWLDGKELRQIAYAGIPLLSKLSEFYSKQEGRKVSTSEIKSRISNREVSFDDVKSIFWQMTDAGGQFYNMQQTLSETLLGRYNKLKDAWEIMLADFASGKSVIGGTFMMAIDLVTKFVQSLHSLGPVVAAAFSGIALTRFTKSFGGNAGAAFLSNKARMSDEMLRRRMSGETLTPYEQTNFIANRGRITDADLKTLTRSGQLNKLETQRLYLAGRITTEQYKQTMALLNQRGAIAGLNAQASMYSLSWRKVGLSIKFAGLGMLNIGKGIFSMLGGLPGLALTGITMAVSYFMNKNAELKQAMEQTASELEDRKKSISEFLRDNKTDTALKNGDEKEISNLIDAYKEKLKEIAPERKNAFEFGLAERKGNEERLKYLEEQLRLMREIAKESEKRLSDDDKYSSFDDAFQDAKTVSEKYSDARAKANMVMATQADFSNLNAMQDQYDEQIAIMRNKLVNELGDISKDPKLQGQASQIMSSFFDKNGWDQDVADQFRADVLNAMGVETDFYEEKFKDSLSEAINKTFPWIGDKIRNNQELTSAEKTQVTNLMKDAAAQVKKDYPGVSNSLKDMLAKDRFEAVIHLVFDADETELERQAGSNTKMSNGDGYAYHRRSSKSKQIAKGAGDSRYKYRQDYDSAVSSASKELKERKSELNKGLISLDDYNAAVQNFEDLRLGFREQFGVDWVDSSNTKKTGRRGSGTGGVKEDSLLKNLQERLSSLKSARQMYQKFKPYMSDDEAKKRTYKAFPNVVGLDLDDYENAVNSLIKNSKFKATTSERKKFLTSLNREKAEWRWDEIEKPAIEVTASERSAYMERLSSRWDLYKSLLEKSGNENYARAAWIDAFQMDDKTKSLMDLYYQNFGKQFNLQDALNMSDEEAKKTFKSPDEYNEWKKIVDLLRNNYVQSLQDGAEAMAQTMSMAQKLDAVTNKYDEKRKNAKGNQDLIDRYNYLEQNEKSGILFEQLKSEINWEGIFGNIDKYSKKELRKIRKDINSLVSGGLLKDMSASDIKSFYDGIEKLNQAIDGQGFGGLKGLIKEMADASQRYDEAVKEYNEAVVKYGKNSYQAENARRKMQDAQNRKQNAGYSVDEKERSRVNDIMTIVDMFRTLGSGDGSGSALLSNAGSWTSTLMSTFGGDDAKKNSKMVGSIVGMFAGLTEAIAQKGFGGFLSDAFEDIGGAVSSTFKDMFGINLGLNGADYDDYNDAKAEYEGLISVWDSLISKKTEYMNIHWGTEATEASKEAQAMLQAEIEQTKIIARQRLSSGASKGSHSIDHRMWSGSYKYNGQNWKDVAPEISNKYGVQFNEMGDLINMSSDTLSKIKQDYVGFWANLDSEYRDYLEKLIEYGDKADDMIDSMTEKLTGNKFSSLVESWGDAMSQMSNSSDSLVDNFEDNLKKAILNSMITDLYGDKIKEILAKAKKYGDSKESVDWYVNGQYMGPYTPQENAEIKSDVEEVAKQVEATRDFFKKSYGWPDNSSSSSRNSVKGITEDTADLLVSYCNSMRADLSVVRETQAKYFPEMSEIAKSQLTQLNMISQNTLRNADAAERIETIFISFNDNFNKVLNGTKKLNVK